jgi:NADH-quinone oxidoreductase subunit N
MYMRPAEGETEALSGAAMTLALGAAVAVVVVLGVIADPVVKLAQAASAILL